MIQWIKVFFRQNGKFCYLEAEYEDEDSTNLYLKGNWTIPHKSITERKAEWREKASGEGLQPN